MEHSSNTTWATGCRTRSRRSSSGTVLMVRNAVWAVRVREVLQTGRLRSGCCRRSRSSVGFDRLADTASYGRSPRCGYHAASLLPLAWNEETRLRTRHERRTASGDARTSNGAVFAFGSMNGNQSARQNPSKIVETSIQKIKLVENGAL